MSITYYITDEEQSRLHYALVAAMKKRKDVVEIEKKHGSWWVLKLAGSQQVFVYDDFNSYLHTLFLGIVPAEAFRVYRGLHGIFWGGARTGGWWDRYHHFPNPSVAHYNHALQLLEYERTESLTQEQARNFVFSIWC